LGCIFNHPRGSTIKVTRVNTIVVQPFKQMPDVSGSGSTSRAWSPFDMARRECI